MRWTTSLCILLAVAAHSAALTGCSFVSDGERQDIKDQLDDDADGVPDVADCDDEDPRRRPTGEEGDPWYDPEWREIPYDGIDNDCDGEDLVDIDGDNFAGIDYDTYIALAAEELGIAPENVPWPTTVDQDEVDCVDLAPSQTDPKLGDGNLTSADINPAVLSDTPYDGVDQDCARDNDFDSDRDGQMPSDAEGPYDTYLEVWGLDPAIDFMDAPIDPANPYGDCDDNLESVYTGAPGEVFYDGIDQDCSGNNDFDQDGDGYYPAGLESGLTQYINAYYPETGAAGPNGDWGPGGTGETQPGDCLDAEHPDVPQADPNQVFPGATDDWYDGVDSNCDGVNDFDQDGDTYIRDVDITAFDDFIAAWSTSGEGYTETLVPFEADAGDCDDMNPAAAPGNIETVGDDADSDCDGGPDSTPWGFNGESWEAPVPPRIVRTGPHYVIGISALSTSLFNRTNPALAFLFEPANAGYQADRDDEVVWNNPAAQGPFVHSRGLDLVSSGDTFWIGTTYLQPANPLQNRLLVREQVWSGTAYEPVAANRVFSWHGFDADFDLQIDDNGELWAMACGGGGRDDAFAPSDDPVEATMPNSVKLFQLATPIQQNVTMQDVGVLQSVTLPDSNAGQTCFMEVDPTNGTAIATACDGEECLSYDADASADLLAQSLDTTWNSADFREADYHDGLLLFAHATGGGATVRDTLTAMEYEVFPGEEVYSVDAMWRNSILYVAGVVENDDGTGNTIKLSYGDPSVGFETIEMPVYDNDDRYTHVPANDCDLETPVPERCTTGRNLDPYAVSLHADEERLVLAMSAASVDTPLEPIDTITAQPVPQDAFGWVFLQLDPSL
jgi:hypothetical protein